MNITPNEDEVERLFKKLDNDAKLAGYRLNPDEEFAKDLVKSLIINEKRYNYRACPCRLASGKKNEDLDIICPCDYRDADVDEYGACYCALYVSQDVLDDKKKIGSIPERRPQKKERAQFKKIDIKRQKFSLTKPIWRCKVCGYLCGRDDPPSICPICKAKKDRFELFIPL